MKKYKFSAFLIALCMLVSIIPAIPTATAQAAEATQVIALNSSTTTSFYEVTFENGYDWQVNQSKSHTSAYGHLAASVATQLNSIYSKVYFAENGHFLAFDFKVKADGYYNIDVMISGRTDRDYTITTVTKIDQKTLGEVKHYSSNYTEQNTEDVQNIGSMYLTEGVHTIVFTRISAGDKISYENGNIWLKQIILTKTEAPEVTANTTKTIKLLDTENRGNFAIMTIPENEWEIDEATTDAEIYAQMMGTGNDRPYCALYNSCSRIHMAYDDAVGFAFVVDATGYYDLTANINTGYDIGVYAAADASIDDTPVGSIDCYVTTGSGYVDVKLKDRVYLEAGRHVLKLRRTSTNSDRLYIASLTLTASDVQEAAAETPFGYRYALVRNSTENGDATYSLYVISGISDTNYKNAGFELKIGDATKTLTTQNVYKNFYFTNDAYYKENGNEIIKRTTAIAPIDFALSDGYIYYVEFKLSEDEVNSAMDITAFVTDADDNQIKGETATVAAK